MNITNWSSRRPLMLCFAAAFALIASASGARAGIADNVKYEKLANGLQILVLVNRKAPVATLNVFYHVGSRNETFGRTGISHLCEHLMFRGTKKYGPEQFSNIIQENGGEDNAFTSADYTDYFEVINRDHLDVPIGLEADRMANFAPKGFDSEKAVVMEERRMRTEDSPQEALEEQVQAAAFTAHPYHWPVIGWMHDIQGLTLEDALHYHALYYSPQNAIVVAVGDFDAAKVMKQIEESFGAIANGPKPPPVTEVEPPQEGEREITLRHAANLPAIAIAYHVPNYSNPSDAFAIEIAGEILGDGKSSRLYRDLVVEKQMVVDVGIDYDMTAFDPTLFWISAQMRPGIKAEDVLAEVDRQVDLMRNGTATPDELQKAKNQEESGFVFGQDSIFREAMLLGTYQMLGDYHMADRYLPQIERVSTADVQRVVKQYLVKPNRSVGVLVPTGLLPHEAGGGGMGAVHHAPPLGVDAENAGGVAMQSVSHERNFAEVER
ncbi:MAG TPA: pitrilysin family protein [Candidatus Binataceae bacterium]|nr:pitrilysin family protein [Candidatus Binataceae bacterium]